MTATTGTSSAAEAGRRNDPKGCIRADVDIAHHRPPRAASAAAPFTTSFGTYETLDRPFVVIETSDGLRGVGEIPTLLDPAYKAEVDTPAVLTSLREFIVPSVARFQREQGPIDSIPALRESYAWVKGAVFAKSGVEAAIWDIEAQRAGNRCGDSGAASAARSRSGSASAARPIEQVLDLAEKAVGLGYGRLKVKIWPGFDDEVARAVRERYPDILLQVDANSAYTWRTGVV